MNDMINCMKYLWERIERKNWSESAKYKCLLCLLSAVFGASGLLAWLAVQIGLGYAARSAGCFASSVAPWSSHGSLRFSIPATTAFTTGADRQSESDRSA